LALGRVGRLHETRGADLRDALLHLRPKIHDPPIPRVLRRECLELVAEVSQPAERELRVGVLLPPALRILDLLANGAAIEQRAEAV